MTSRYLDLLRGTLTRSIWFDHPQHKEIRQKGLDWPLDAETMIGDERLLNIQFLAQIVLHPQNRIPGDFMECGVWRGGAAIFMRALLGDSCDQFDNDSDREGHCRACGEEWDAHAALRGSCVWVADSFQGLPKPNPEAYPADLGDSHYTKKELCVNQSEVEANFRRYGLLDDRVKFIPGFFKDSLPGPVKQLALLRIDADMYESTMQALEACYPLLSPGGYVIVDDYRNIRNTQQAVDDFRAKTGDRYVTPLLNADSWCAVYWRKP